MEQAFRFESEAKGPDELKLEWKVAPGYALYRDRIQVHLPDAGGVQVAPLLAASHDRGAVLAEVHGWLGDAILWLAGLHALAALYHHYLLRDGVLSSMLPPWLTRSR